MSYLPELPLPDLLLKKDMHDISVPLESAPLYPGDRPFSRQWLSRFDDGSDCCLSFFSMGSHSGTHLDFPSHIFPDGLTLDCYPLSRFIIPAQVLSIQDTDTISAQTLLDIDINRGEAILFKTRNSSKGLMHNPVFMDRYVHLTSEATEICVSRGAGLVGIDYLSVDSYLDDSLPVHRILLGNDTLVLEGIDLAEVNPGRYWLICLPLRINAAEATPVRAVLVV